MEAIKSLFALDTNVPVELLENVINDRDPKVSEAAVVLIGSSGMKEGVQPLLRILDGIDFFGSRRSLRVKCIRAHTRPEANASTRVLAKCGFVLIGPVVDPEDGPVWRWERNAQHIGTP